jgi:hypothetical protein
MAEMLEVRCQDCGELLGHQGGEEIVWELWRHNRCPVRLARALGLNAELYEKAVGVATAAICGAYPDFPTGLSHAREQAATVRTLRARIAAEVVMESLGVVGFKLRTA